MSCAGVFAYGGYVGKQHFSDAIFKQWHESLLDEHKLAGEYLEKLRYADTLCVNLAYSCGYGYFAGSTCLFCDKYQSSYDLCANIDGSRRVVCMDCGTDYRVIRTARKMPIQVFLALYNMHDCAKLILVDMYFLMSLDE